MNAFNSRDFDDAKGVGDLDGPHDTVEPHSFTAPAVGSSDLLACDWQQLADWLQDNANHAKDAPLWDNGRIPLSFVATLEKWANGCRKQAEKRCL